MGIKGLSVNVRELKPKNPPPPPPQKKKKAVITDK